MKPFIRSSSSEAEVHQ